MAQRDIGSAQSRNQRDGLHQQTWKNPWSGYEDKRKLESPGIDTGNLSRHFPSRYDLEQLRQYSRLVTGRLQEASEQKAMSGRKKLQFPELDLNWGRDLYNEIERMIGIESAVSPSPVPRTNDRKSQRNPKRHIYTILLSNQSDCC